MTPSTSAPDYHPPAPAQAEPASQQRHGPPTGPAARPTETPSGNRPAPKPDPDPDPTHATVPADAPRANAPGRELPTGVPHPEGGTSETRPAAAEVIGGTRALAGHVGGQPRPTPVPDRQTREAAQLAESAATPPAPPAQQQREEPLVDATEETGGPPQRTQAPLPAADLPARGPTRAEIPSRAASQQGNKRASAPANRPPNTVTSGSDEAPDAGQPGTGPGGPMPDAGHAAGHPPPTAHGAQPAGHAGAAPPTAPAHRSDGSAPKNAASREAPPRGLPGAHAKSEARATTPDMPKHAADKGTLPGRAKPRRRLFRRLHGVLQE